jgi:hypothetical protein
MIASLSLILLLLEKHVSYIHVLSAFFCVKLNFVQQLMIDVTNYST